MALTYREMCKELERGHRARQPDWGKDRWLEWLVPPHGNPHPVEIREPKGDAHQRTMILVIPDSYYRCISWEIID